MNPINIYCCRYNFLCIWYIILYFISKDFLNNESMNYLLKYESIFFIFGFSFVDKKVPIATIGLSNLKKICKTGI